MRCTKLRVVIACLLIIAIYLLQRQRPGAILQPSQSSDTGASNLSAQLAELAEQLQGKTCKFVDSCDKSISVSVWSVRNSKYVCLETAARCIGELGSAARSLVPLVIEAIENNVEQFDTGDGVYDVRAAFVETLSQIGDRSIVPLLIRLLETSHSSAQRATLKALAKFGPEAADAEPSLKRILAAADKSLYGDAAVALGSLKRPENAELIAKLLSSTETTIDALYGLRQIGAPAASAFDQILQTLDRKGDVYYNSNINNAVARTLESLGAGLSEEQLLLIANRPDPVFKLAFSRIVSERANASAQIINLLATNLSGSNELKLETLRAIAALGSSAKSLSAKVVELLSAKEEETARTAARTLVAIGPRYTAVPMLKVIAQGDGDAKRAALSMLARFGRALAPLVDDIAGLKSSQSVADKPYILRALAAARVRNGAIEALVRKHLSDTEPEVRAAATSALANVVVDQNTAVAPLEQMLADNSTAVRVEAATALALLGSAAESSVPKLIAILEHEQKPYAIFAMLEALRSINTEDASGELRRWASAGIERTIKMLGSEDYQTRYEGARRIGIYSFDIQRCGPLLASSLLDDDSWVRNAAAEALGKFGTSAANWSPELKRALADPITHVQRMAAMSLLIVSDYKDSTALPYVLQGATDFADLNQEKYLRFLEIHFPSQAKAILESFPKRADFEPPLTP